jgi:hypothetical protein
VAAVAAALAATAVTALASSAGCAMALAAPAAMVGLPGVMVDPGDRRLRVVRREDGRFVRAVVGLVLVPVLDLRRAVLALRR